MKIAEVRAKPTAMPAVAASTRGSVATAMTTNTRMKVMRASTASP